MKQSHNKLDCFGTAQKARLAMTWTVALVYVAFIYATLEVAGIPLKFLRERGVLRLTLFSGYTLLAGGLIIGLIRTQTRQLWRYASLFLIFGLYVMIARQISFPEEEVHFLEYGLVGIFFIRALKLHITSPWKYFLAAFLLASLAGWIDEIIQGILPNRHYDVRDIALNCVSSFLGLCIYALFCIKPSPRFFAPPREGRG